MPKIPKGKKGLFAVVDEVIYARLWQFIKRKYDKNVYGAVSFEVENALEYYLDTIDSNTNLHKNQKDPVIPKGHRTAQRILRSLRESGYQNQCTVTEVYKAIETIRGFDPRTKEKWAKFLVDNHYVEWVNNRILKISDSFKEADDFSMKLERLSEKRGE